MTLAEYQAFAARGVHEATLEREPILGFALGLVGETGEVVDDIKKRMFHGRDIPMEHTEEELGDVLWYVANIATQYGFSLESIIEKNVSKLIKRYPEKYTGHAECSSEQLSFFNDWQENVDTHMPVIGRGVYKGSKVFFTLSGPHIAMYDSTDNKFIKFLNKEEKKSYGLNSKENCGADTADVASGSSEDVSDGLPWD